MCSRRVQRRPITVVRTSPSIPCGRPGKHMAMLRAHGIAATLPDGFEGRIFIRPHLAGRARIRLPISRRSRSLLTWVISAGER